MANSSIRTVTSLLGPIFRLPKVLVFAVVGATGAFLGAVVGEFFLPASEPLPERMEEQVITLCLDVSGSMMGSRLLEAKQAAQDFASKKVRQGVKVGVVAFGAQLPESLQFLKNCQSEADVNRAVEGYTQGDPVRLQALINDVQSIANTAWVVTDPTQDENLLKQRINNLDAMGRTPMHGGLKAAREQLLIQAGTKWTLLFTDGMPDDPELAISSAGLLHEHGIDLIAVGTGDCNRAYLERLTGSPDTVFMASDGEFGMAFSQAEKRMGSLVSETGGTTSWAILYVGLWTACLASGLLLVLVGAQNLYLMREPYTKQKFLRGLSGGFIIGFLSGAVAQVIYFVVGADGDVGFILNMITRGPGWALFGILIALGMTSFIANMARQVAAVAGGVGGLAGAFAYILISSTMGDTSGRLAGALIIGGVIGSIIAVVEILSTRMWLEIVWPDGQKRRVNLGETPVHIGKMGTQNSVSENIMILGAMDDVQYDFSIEYTAEGLRCKCRLANEDTTYLAKAGEEFEMLTKDYKSAKVRICGR